MDDKTKMSFLIPINEKTELTALAREKGVTKTQIIRESIKLYSRCNHQRNPCPVCGSIKEN